MHDTNTSRPFNPSAPSLAALAALCLSLATLFACGGDTPQEPAARVEVGATEVDLPYPGTATLVTSWQPLLPLTDGAAVVFVHLTGEDGEILRTFDHPFPQPWTVGAERAEDSIRLWQSALAEPLPPGRYTLTMGLVEAGSGRRWPLAFEGSEPEAVDRGEYAVATVTVAERQSASMPEVGFTGPWKPSVPGSDRQVLATRMLGGPGGLLVRGVTGPVEIELALHIPSPEETGYRLVSEAPDGGAPVIVDSDCGSGPVEIAGTGTHTVRLVLQPPSEGDECAVRIEPRFALVDPTTFDRLAVQLQRLTWSTAGEGTAGPEAAPDPGS